MTIASANHIRPTHPALRRLMLGAAILVFLAGVQLFVLTEDTDRFFAWTIDVPLTAAFLGAGYWASVLIEFLASKEPVWAYARIAVPSVLTFTTLTLVATLIHLDLFHLGAGFEVATQLVTWLWIAIYASVPVMMTIMIGVQLQQPGTDPPRNHPLPPWMHSILIVHALLMLALGAALFLAPVRTLALWPWELTELTARAVGAWVFSIGIAAAHAAVENDVPRVRLAAVSYLGLGVLQTAALARYSGTVTWGADTLIYLAVLATILLVGAAGVRLSVRADRVLERVHRP